LPPLPRRPLLPYTSLFRSAALADTVNIAELRGGKIYPGNSAVGEVLAVGANVKKFKAGDIVVTHCNGEPDIYGYPLRIWAYDQRSEEHTSELQSRENLVCR